MTVSKRDLLTGAVASVGIAGVAQAASAAPAVSEPALSPLPDLKAALSQPLLNRARATAVMQAAGVEALVLSNPVNVYYATNRLPGLNHGEPNLAGLAVIPRDPAQPVAYIGPIFDYYYIVSDQGLPAGVEAFLVYPAPAGAPSPSAAARGMFRDLAVVPMDAGEQARRAATIKAGEATYPTTVAALAKALGPLAARSARIGVDSYDSLAVVSAAAPMAQTQPGEDIVRRVRLVKTPSEVALMRAASHANVEAALATAHAVREEGTLRTVRQRFFAEAAARGNTGVFMVVDGVIGEAIDRPLVDGQALLLDCVSQYAGYHGDYARTVFIGEPRAPMLRVTKALATGWDEVRTMIKPGVRFSEIASRGHATLKKFGYDYSVSFGPHMVGLYHTDQPRFGLDGKPEDIVLEEGMIVSVDCPLLDTGVGGTAHLEDLTLITADGGEQIHAIGDRTVVV